MEERAAFVALAHTISARRLRSFALLRNWHWHGTLWNRRRHCAPSSNRVKGWRVSESMDRSDTRRRGTTRAPVHGGVTSYRLPCLGPVDPGCAGAECAAWSGCSKGGLGDGHRGRHRGCRAWDSSRGPSVGHRTMSIKERRRDAGSRSRPSHHRSCVGQVARSAPDSFHPRRWNNGTSFAPAGTPREVDDAPCQASAPRFMVHMGELCGAW